MPNDLAPAITLTIFALVNSGHSINPSMAFTTLSLIALLTTPIHVSILTIPEALNMLVSLGRIEHFLRREDNEPRDLCGTTGCYKVVRRADFDLVVPGPEALLKHSWPAKTVVLSGSV